MKNRRLVVLVLIFLAQSMSKTQALGELQMAQKADAMFAFSQLKTTLSKLYPIEHWSMSTATDQLHPFAPRFCWEFFRPSPEALGRLSAVIKTYKSNVSWIFGPPSGDAMCLVAVTPGTRQFVGYPPIGLPETQLAGASATQQFVVTEEFIDLALADLPSFCSYLERNLGLESLVPINFDPRLIALPDPPSPESVPVDFVERGMHLALIIRSDPTKQQHSKDSNDRRLLHFSVRESEWRRIHADILESGSPMSELSGTVVFPFLSRIEETESSYFRGTEVEELRQECLRARASTSDTLAIRGLDKLILMCIWAHQLGGDISLRAP